jgi:hypothetical protein
MLPTIQAALIVCAALGGLGIGVWLAFKVAVVDRAFSVGVVLAAIPVALMGVMGGFLVGGWLEGLLGTNLGVPTGVLVGTVIGSFLAATIAGFVGRLVSMFF